MSGNHCSRLQGFDLIQRAQPLTSGLFVALSEVRVRVVVDRIPRYNQANRRQIQRSGVLRVGMAKFYYFQFFALQMYGVAVENLWRYQLRWNLARKARLPERLYEVRVDLVLHGGNRGSGGKRSCVGKPVEQEFQTEEMIAVSMGDVDGCKILTVLG